MKYKFALIGKNISHSKSKEVYERILDEEVDYTLLDYPEPSKIPALKDLLELYPRISITAPYKNVVFKNIDVFENNFLSLESVNAIKLNDGKVIGTNTDISAFIKIYETLREKYPGDVILLGDGNMAKMIMLYFDSHKIKYHNLSRRQGTLDLFAQDYNGEKLIINACAREYVFNASISQDALLWDMNYNQKVQQEICIDKKMNYLDGYSLLLEQAKFALSFWN